MFLRKIFSSSVRDSDSQEVPSIIITVPAQPEAAPQRGLRRTAAVSNLASLDEVPEAAMDVQFTSSTVTIVHGFAAVTLSESRVERRAAASFLSMKKGYELEDNSLHFSQRLVSFDDAEESSSDYDDTPVKNERLVVRANIQSTKNSTDPDSLEKIWNGRVTP